ncbi:DUF2726 domain-containing protein [Salmonella enterica subsp. enterica]|uniref:DUF2726 domain-containing protein n=1 Tax=Salmonella enterica subsp. enterica serovar Hofit TaxID=2564537 RepID=A0A5W8MA68_SALET|nr:hypothetical protein [Salmonella enterica subsp. enterica serovar Mikawasima]EAZ0194288.1 DUF2726 domain-containing protein [Salmonella enterica]EBY1552508.1 DUF2726 domain-containing protein [Salmonella enterica subsp. enterica serovar Hofit]ECF2557985.1 DUF2726 domain-containing protein [Salmonella enterica subsp. enterica serovar Ahuza]EDW0520491.1 DUF2726 domain-containing protein [Salmonella enterica subsp. enterica]
MPPLMIIILIVFIVSIIIATKLINTREKNTNKEQHKETKASEIINKNKDSYEIKSFLTERERYVFNNLKNDLKPDLHLLAQVRVADLIKPNKRYHEKSKEYYALFKQISQWHVDYAILNLETYEIITAIELDDASHQKPGRQKRDHILNTVFEQAGIKLLRINNYEQLKLEYVIKNLIRQPEIGH